MRFVELRSSPDGESFTLHPRITWLRGLDPAARVATVGFVHDVALGEEPDWTGVVEVDGTQSDLAACVAEVGQTAESALIIDAASLPEPGPRTESDDAQAASLEAAQAKLSELDDRIAALGEELASSEKVRSQMTASLASAKARLEPEADGALDQADAALFRAARLADRPDPWTGMDDVPDRIAELRTLIEEFDGSLSSLPSGDRPALAAAAATARAALSAATDGTVPNPEAVALAEAWLGLHQRLRGLESRMEAHGGGTEVIAARLDAARKATKIAEDAAMPRRITQEETDHLEMLHEAVLGAESKAGKGVRRGAGRAAFERAEAELQAALDPLGYPTWAAFRMGNGKAAVPEEALVQYDLALTELEAAEVEWAQLMAHLEQDTDLQDVLTAIDRAREHARNLLGEGSVTGAADPEDVADALRGLVVDAASVGVDRESSMGHLRAAMAEAGAIGHEELTSDQAIIALADSWLGVLATADELAVRILRDRERAAEELDALESLGDGSRVDRLQGERDAVRAAEKAVADSRDALAQIMQARLQLHVLAATELTLAEEHDDRLVQRESAQVLVDLARQRLAGTAGGDGVAALAERVPRGLAGPIPVVVVMGDTPAATLDRLEGLPDDVQILVVGEGSGAEEWLARVGPDVASVIDVGALV